MNKIYRKLGLALLCVMATCSIFGANEARDGEDIAHQLGKRFANTKADRQEIKAMRVEQEKAAFGDGITPPEVPGEVVICKEQEILIGNENTEEGAQEATVMSSPKAQVSYTTTHEGVFHTVSALTTYRDYVTLNDGLSWVIRPSDRWKTGNFNISVDYDQYGNSFYYFTDSILILAGDFFSSYDYVLVNQTTGDRLEADLVEPLKGQPVTTYFVTGVLGNHVFLNDNSEWIITYSDRTMVNRWQLGDSITVGLNDGFFMGMDKNILINVNLNEYIRGFCIN